MIAPVAVLVLAAAVTPDVPVAVLPVAVAPVAVAVDPVVAVRVAAAPRVLLVVRAASQLAGARVSAPSAKSSTTWLLRLWAV
jgi:hypothetical protein